MGILDMLKKLGKSLENVVKENRDKVQREIDRSLAPEKKDEARLWEEVANLDLISQGQENPEEHIILSRAKEITDQPEFNFVKDLLAEHGGKYDKAEYCITAFINNKDDRRQDQYRLLAEKYPHMLPEPELVVNEPLAEPVTITTSVDSVEKKEPEKTLEELEEEFSRNQRRILLEKIRKQEEALRLLQAEKEDPPVSKSKAPLTFASKTGPALKTIVEETNPEIIHTPTNDEATKNDTKATERLTNL